MLGISNCESLTKIIQIKKTILFKILLLLVNVDDPSFLLRDLNLLCYRVQITLILCYSVEEAAEYVETFKKTENKNFEKALEDINKWKQQYS